jgi:retron-type reverse transcriptase
MKLQLFVGSEKIRLFNYRDGNNNDGRMNNKIYCSLDLHNMKRVIFSSSVSLCRSQSFNRRKINYSTIRYYTSPIKSNNNTENLTGELNKLAKSLIKKNVWPMEDRTFKKQAILLKKREEIRIGKQCTDVFKNSQNLILILNPRQVEKENDALNEILNAKDECEDNNSPDDIKRKDESKDKNLTKNNILKGKSVDKNKNEIFLQELMKGVEFKLESLTWKILAIELVSKSLGSSSPGVDGIAFQKVSAKTDNRQRANRILSEEIANLKQKISLAKGKTNQAIQRKGINKLNEREKLRRWLKKEGRLTIIYMKKRFKELTNHPIFEANMKRKIAINHNLNLKFELLAKMKYNKIKNFIADPIRRVLIPKANSKDLRPLGIPTIRDRCVQMILKIALEPIMEPLGDYNSFGYRRGRSAHQAVSHLSNFLAFRRRDGSKRKRQKTFKNKIREKPKVKIPEFYSTMHIFDCDIKGFFDNISHDWIMATLPIPHKYKHLLLSSLKAPIKYNEEIINEETKSGLMQGGIISPLLANWTLDGLDATLHKCIYTKTNHEWSGYFYPPGKREFLEKKNLLTGLTLRRHKERASGRNTVSVVRFADDFIVVSNNKELKSTILNVLKTFLYQRGLVLSDTKTKIFPWIMGAKLDYLGWTFIQVNPKRVTWMVKAKKELSGRLKDWAGMYCYPSSKSTKSLRNKVKSITNMSNTFKSVDKICQELSLLIRGWSNYFSPGGKQRSLRTHLDWYIDKRCRRYLFRKFGPSKIRWAINRFCRFQSKYVGLHVKNNYGVPSTFRVPFIRKLGVDAPWSLIKPSAELLNTSCIVNPAPYIERRILLDYLDNKESGLLYKEQDGLCSICNSALHMYIENDDNLNLDDEESKHGPTHRNDWYRKNIDADWDYVDNTYKGLQIDHKIPIALSLNVPRIYKTLDNIENKQLVHSDCHKIKTKEDKVNIKRFKELTSTNINKGFNKVIAIEKAIKDKNIKNIYYRYISYVNLEKTLGEIIVNTKGEK